MTRKEKIEALKCLIDILPEIAVDELIAYTTTMSLEISAEIAAEVSDFYEVLHGLGVKRS